MSPNFNLNYDLKGFLFEMFEKFGVFFVYFNYVLKGFTYVQTISVLSYYWVGRSSCVPWMPSKSQ
jgi:hypothetical protein